MASKKSTRKRPVEWEEHSPGDRGKLVKHGRLTTAAEGFFEALSTGGWCYSLLCQFGQRPSRHPGSCNKSEASTKVPEIITCPSELVALSAALGYAQVTGIPQCVLVHVDCGTLAMGQSIHNASASRVPVLCFAGLSPFTQNGELLGSRTEFIHWVQDVPDQAAIVRQYCRFAGEIKTGRNIKEMVYRALQLTMSDPKGPAYLTAAREVLEESVEREYLGEQTLCPIVPSALPESEVELIATALIGAKRPLVITGYLGRNRQAPSLLAELCDKLPISVVEMVGSDMCLRSDHEGYLGVTVTTHLEVCEADVILILDCDVPWIPTAGKPQKVFSFNMTRRLRVSCAIALKQLNAFLDKQSIDRGRYTKAFEARSNRYQSWRENLRSLETVSVKGVISTPYLTSRLRNSLPQDTIYVLEAVTNAGHVINHLNLTQPGSLVGTGAGGLGWGGGASLGIKLAKPDSFICAIIGDGSYLFSQMESVYWIARRYNIPFLCIVLNNSGWNAPKVSALLVHKDGLSSKSNMGDLNLSFNPSPDYPGIAAAAGGAWGATVKVPEELDPALKEAIHVVRNGRCAVVDVAVPSMWKEN
ncbi:Thiamine pyrophosphate enzyme C-terminal TPP-binding [Penicillium lagena]|uniref:Thiamine pyrophosphate enzyme C-terminal TPP-binding n=1 Tax=Penicillium lagena TaxID=94218 RepID=UPI00253FC21A|nr:Thiamine pyrophosphate enzyme C-terminal TPP-binding [Penicillium lagena]KAJ5610479.1 Thiamine pyrophosphate enzyme C-terminal TPP-binding [Penicillium lagena]